ncbi:MAG: hypothetical protein AAF193_06265, partial [Bacteroidota bacterium]
MKLFSFADINSHLLEALPPILEALQGRQFHYVKIAQHALTYAYQQNTNKLIQNRFDQPMVVQKGMYRLKEWKRGLPTVPDCEELLLLDSGRTFPDAQGEMHSVYFHHWIEGAQKGKITHAIVPSGIQDAVADIQLSQLQGLSNAKLNKQEQILLEEINKVIKKVIQSGHLNQDQLNYLKSAFHRFFEEFHFYFQLLQHQKTQTIVATNHYHQEGLIAACKILGIRFVEIQHGLMSQNDLYYHYDKDILPKTDLTLAFFPDDLILYGPFWKQLLSTGSEHRNTRIHIGGDYVFRAEEKQVQTEKEKIIFIGAQKNMHEPYMEYLKKLMPMMESHPEWNVVIKLHPLEKKKDLYYSFKHPQLQVVGNESDLMDLLSRCAIQIS